MAFSASTARDDEGKQSVRLSASSPLALVARFAASVRQGFAVRAVAPLPTARGASGTPIGRSDTVGGQKPAPTLASSLAELVGSGQA